MNWKSILMAGLMQAPAIVAAVDGIKGSGADKRSQALAGVMLGMQSFQRVDPQDFERVFANPKVQEAISLATDHIHFALKTVDTVSAGLPAPALPEGISLGQHATPPVPIRTPATEAAEANEATPRSKKASRSTTAEQTD